MNEDTIAALSTPAGMGAISVIRISGPEALQIAGKVFVSPSGKSLSAVATHTAHFGTVMDGDSAIDEVIATVFRAPKSFTGEDTVEFSCHGSVFIQQQMLQLLVPPRGTYGYGWGIYKKGFPERPYGPFTGRGGGRPYRIRVIRFARYGYEPNEGRILR